MNIYKSSLYGMIQLTKNEIGQGLSAYQKGSAPYGQVYWRFNDEINDYTNSRQNRWQGGLNFSLLNDIHNFLLIICLFLLCICMFSPLRNSVDQKMCIVLNLSILFIVLLNIRFHT